MAITSSFANLATVTRASKKTDAGGWDFTNGGTVGALTEYASGVAALHATAGILVEESSTNEIRNPRGEGASGSTPPTYWNEDGIGGLSAAWSSGTDSISDYAQVTITGTASSENYDIRLEALDYISATSGQAWASSMGVEIAGGDTTAISDIRLRTLTRTASANVDDTQTVITPGPENKRWFNAISSAGAGTVGITPILRINAAASGTVNITLKIRLPQIENKAYPTSPIVPEASSPAATTRAADYVALALGSWFSSTAWTAFFSLKPTTAGVTGRVVGGIGDTFDNTAYLDIGSSGGTRATARFWSGGSSAAALTPSGQSNYAVGDTLKAAIGAEADNFAMSLNGATQATDTSGAMPASNSRLSLGNGPWSASVNNTFCGYITDFRYFPRRLSNAELEALVGN
jgi:hypothetical protein